jgi:hypothetical protein
VVDTSGTHTSGPSTELSEAPPACDLVTVPARQGLEAVDLLRHGAGVGAVLHDAAGSSLAFLVPPGTAAAWDVPGSSCAPASGRPAEWLLPPHTAPSRAPLTDPATLRAALGEAARTIALATT